MSNPAVKKARKHHPESHASGRSGWLRAAVLGADDGVVSTTSLMLGIAASDASTRSVLTAGVAGLVAGAMSMAVGEYVSVSSQRDAQEADISKEKRELEEASQAEMEELIAIYVARGLERGLATRVAEQLTAHDPLGAHLRDELALDDEGNARPVQAAWVSAASFASFALVPIIALLASPPGLRLYIMAGLSLTSLAGLGALGGYLGGAPIRRAALRVTLGGALAMGITTAIGFLFGATP